MDGIDREVVESSTIRAMGYDPERQILAVEFRTGHVFHYQNVDADLVMEFYSAGSKGQFYSSYIRHKFPSTKMTGICDYCRDIGPLGAACRVCQQGTVRETVRRRLTGEEKVLEQRVLEEP